MMLPTIHRNGTSEAELMKQVSEALQALRAAVRAVGSMAPNGRDYHPQGESAIMQALIEHNGRVRRIGEVLKEVEVIAEGIADGGWKVEAAR